MTKHLEAAQATQRATRLRLAEDEIPDMTHAQNNYTRGVKEKRIERTQTTEGTLTAHQRIEEIIVNHFMQLFQTKKPRTATDLKDKINFCHNCFQMEIVMSYVHPLQCKNLIMY